MKYTSIVTELGTQKLEQSLLGEPLLLDEVRFGSGAGAEYQPTGQETDLKDTVYTTAPLRLESQQIDGKHQVLLEAIIDHNQGGFFLREVGIFDKAGDLIVIGNLPSTFKPADTQGAIKNLRFELVFETRASEQVAIEINPNTVYATKAYVDQQDSRHINEPDPHPQYQTKLIAEQQLGTKLDLAGGKLSGKLEIDSSQGIEFTKLGEGLEIKDGGARLGHNDTRVINIKESGTQPPTDGALVITCDETSSGDAQKNLLLITGNMTDYGSSERVQALVPLLDKYGDQVYSPNHLPSAEEIWAYTLPLRVGEWRYSLSDKLEKGWLILNGAEISRTTDKLLWEWANDHELVTKQTNKASTNYCAYFGDGNGYTTFSLPNLHLGHFVRGNPSLADIAVSHLAIQEDAIRNITGSLAVSKCGEGILSKTGAMISSTNEKQLHSHHVTGASNSKLRMHFDASKSVGENHIAEENRPKTLNLTAKICRGKL